MSTFYFTYSNDGTYYFNGGWTEVEAPDEDVARQIFKAIHPNPNDNCIWCAGIYNEDYFKTTEMYRDGNYGAKCQETIKIKVRKNSDTDTEFSPEERIEISNSEWYKTQISQQRYIATIDMIEALVNRFGEEETFDLEGEDEFNTLSTELCDEYGSDIIRLALDVATGQFNINASKIAEQIIEDRVKVYRVTVNFSGSFDLIVKATDEDSARRYVDNMDSWEMDDFVKSAIDDGCDFEASTNYYDRITEVNPWDYDESEILDATE